MLRRLHRVARDSQQAWDDVIVTALETPLRLGLWIGVVYLALRIYPLPGAVQQAVLAANDTCMVLLLAWFIARLIKGIEGEMLAPTRSGASSADRATVRAVAKLGRITLWVVAALMVLQSVGVSISGLLAFGGIGGIAVGFAAKDLLANFFGGLSIYLDRPFTVGDWIRSPDREIEGTVESIGWRLTVIRTFDQRPLYVPNAVFSQIAVENPSRMFNRRIYETIGLRYQDADKVGAIVTQVREMLQQHPAIDPRRTLIVNFVSFGASSLDFFVYTFTRTTVWVEYHAIKEDILLQILDIIHANGADVAFPTRTLHVQREQPEPEA
ncbi:MAG: mechanosensitive ion channel protein MscS [Halioglobus sp.]|nr:mechanosensitive ion channel protein MscS [Halioglobus sp.]